MLKVAVIGVGHLGKEHARVFQSIPEVNLVAIVDSNKKQREKIADKYQVKCFESYHEIIGEVDAVSIATPTVSHYEICCYFLKNKIHVFVEKPMTQLVSEAEELVRLAEQYNVKLQVGHIERFNPVVMEIINRNLQPFYIETLRLSPFRFRSGDIGVVLDLMIHDIDIVCTLVNSEIEKVDAIGMNLFGENEDIANARIQFKSGCVANISSSRASLKPTRKIRIFSPDSYTSIDYKTMKGVIYKKQKSMDSDSINFQKDIPKKFIGIPFEELFFKKILKKEKISIKYHEPLYKELECFVHCILQNSKPIVSGVDGLKAIQTANLILSDIKSNINRFKSNFS